MRTDALIRAYVECACLVDARWEPYARRAVAGEFVRRMRLWGDAMASRGEPLSKFPVAGIPARSPSSTSRHCRPCPLPLAAQAWPLSSASPLCAQPALCAAVPMRCAWRLGTGGHDAGRDVPGAVYVHQRLQRRHAHAGAMTTRQQPPCGTCAPIPDAYACSALALTQHHWMGIVKALDERWTETDTHGGVCCAPLSVCNAAFLTSRPCMVHWCLHAGSYSHLLAGGDAERERGAGRVARPHSVAGRERVAAAAAGVPGRLRQFDIAPHIKNAA